METKFFMHRIKKENGEYNKGIEVHDTLDSAILSFHAQMKLAYDNPQASGVTFVSCKITDGNGNVVRPYEASWKKYAHEVNTFFMHYIRHDGESYTKGVDVCADFDSARRAFHAQMEYGYGNTKFPNVSFVSCLISDMSGFSLMDDTWNKPDPEPEPEE